MRTRTRRHLPRPRRTRGHRPRVARVCRPQRRRRALRARYSERVLRRRDLHRHAADRHLHVEVRTASRRPERLNLVCYFTVPSLRPRVRRGDDRRLEGRVVRAVEADHLAQRRQPASRPESMPPASSIATTRPGPCRRRRRRSSPTRRRSSCTAPGRSASFPEPRRRGARDERRCCAQPWSRSRRRERGSSSPMCTRVRLRSKMMNAVPSTHRGIWVRNAMRNASRL